MSAVTSTGAFRTSGSCSRGRPRDWFHTRRRREAFTSARRQRPPGAEFTACADTSPQRPHCAASSPTREVREQARLEAMSEHDIESLRRIYYAFSLWDVDELVSDLAHDVEWTMPETLPWGGTRHGHDGVRAFASVSQDHVEGRWADPDDFLDAGDRLVVLGRMRGRAKATGRDYEVEFVHVWTMTDGVASRLRAYFDTAPIIAALDEGPDATSV